MQDLRRFMMRIKKGLSAATRLIYLMALVLILSPLAGQAQDTEGSGGGFLDQLMGTAAQVLNEKLQDEFDRWLGTYEGKIEQVRLIDETPDSLVLEITYKGVKRSDGVSARAEVLKGGMVMPGFSSTIGQIQGKKGRARLTISWSPQYDYYGKIQPVETDQLRLYLVRNDYPDRHFGELLYDFNKKWGEQPNTPAPSGDTQPSGGGSPAPGSILIPVGIPGSGGGLPGTTSGSSGDQQGQPGQDSPQSPGQQEGTGAGFGILQPVGIGQPSGQGVRKPHSAVRIEDEYDLWTAAKVVSWVARHKGTRLSLQDQLNINELYTKPQVALLDSIMVRGESEPLERVLAINSAKGTFPAFIYDRNLKFEARVGTLASHATLSLYLVNTQGEKRCILQKSIRPESAPTISVELRSPNFNHGETVRLVMESANLSCLSHPKIVRTQGLEIQQPHVDTVTSYDLFSHAFEATNFYAVETKLKAKLRDKKTEVRNVIIMPLGPNGRSISLIYPAIRLGGNAHIVGRVADMKGSKLDSLYPARCDVIVYSLERQENVIDANIDIPKGGFVPFDVSLNSLVGDRIQVILFCTGTSGTKIGWINPKILPQH